MFPYEHELKDDYECGYLFVEVGKAVVCKCNEIDEHGTQHLFHESR